MLLELRPCRIFCPVIDLKLMLSSVRLGNVRKFSSLDFSEKHPTKSKINRRTTGNYSAWLLTGKIWPFRFDIFSILLVSQMASVGLVLLRDVVETLTFNDRNVDDPASRRCPCAAGIARCQILPCLLVKRFAGFLRHFNRQIQVGFVVLFTGATTNGRLGRRRFARCGITAISTQFIRPGQ